MCQAPCQARGHQRLHTGRPQFSRTGSVKKGSGGGCGKQAPDTRLKWFQVRLNCLVLQWREARENPLTHVTFKPISKVESQHCDQDKGVSGRGKRKCKDLEAAGREEQKGWGALWSMWWSFQLYPSRRSKPLRSFDVFLSFENLTSLWLLWAVWLWQGHTSKSVEGHH